MNQSNKCTHDIRHICEKCEPTHPCFQSKEPAVEGEGERVSEDWFDQLNNFITKWCDQNAAHLLDTDENDGEKLRQTIRDLERNTERSAIERERARVVGILESKKSNFLKSVDGLGRPKSPTEIMIIAECRGRNYALSDAIASITNTNK